MEIDYAQRMRSLRVEQLFEMIDSKPEDGIVPAAVVAARTELEARNVSEADTQEFLDHVRLVQRHEAAQPYRKLPIGFRVLYGFPGFTTIGMFGLFALYATGRRQMFSDAIVSALIGLATAWILLIAAFLILG